MECRWDAQSSAGLPQTLWKRQGFPQILPQSLAAPCCAPEDALALSITSSWKKGLKKKVETKQIALGHNPNHGPCSGIFLRPTSPG